MAIIGSAQFQGRVWNPGIRISGIQAMAEEWVVDRNLPALGTDPRYPTSDQIVIPRGRLLAVRPDSYTYAGRAVLTVADGNTNKPVGFTETNILRQFEEHIQWTPMVDREAFIEVPYVAAINNAYSGAGGVLKAGDKITAYSGSVTSVNGVPNDKGKIVKWVEKKLYTRNQSAATAASLTAAIYPGMTPEVAMAWNAGTVYTGAAPTFAFNGTNWVATFASSVTDVLYTFGQSVDQIAGEVVRVEPISASHHLSGWLEWVTDNFLAWEYPPMLVRVPTTDVTNEVPTTISTNYYKLKNAPVAPWKTITVQVTGTLIDPLTGASSALSGDTLAVADVPYADYTYGKYYSINPATGELYITGNITVTAIRVSYSYETSYRDGRLYNQGIIGLTDGRYSGIPGTPANLEVSGVVGSLRCVIY